MASTPTHITLSDDNLLAEYVELEQFKGILEQRIAIGPDMLAMLIKDGAIAEASPGGHFAIGGVWRTIKDAIGGRHAIRLLIADLKPFQLSTSASALSKDNVPIVCEFTVDLRKPSSSERLEPYVGLVDGQVAGLLMMWFPLLDNTKFTWFEVHVDPQLRRRGVGSALAEKAVERTRDDGRSTALVEFHVPDDDRTGLAVGHEELVVALQQVDDRAVRVAVGREGADERAGIDHAGTGVGEPPQGRPLQRARAGER